MPQTLIKSRFQGIKNEPQLRYALYQNCGSYLYRIDLKKRQNSLVKVSGFRTVFWSFASLFSINNIHIRTTIAFLLNSFKLLFADNGRMAANCIILPTLSTVCFSFHLRKRSIMTIDFNRGEILAKSEILCYYSI